MNLSLLPLAGLADPQNFQAKNIARFSPHIQVPIMTLCSPSRYKATSTDSCPTPHTSVILVHALSSHNSRDVEVLDVCLGEGKQ